ncbi:putative BSD domain-containing protein [Helianthus debilis subsp. tardiflorus]
MNIQSWFRRAKSRSSSSSQASTNQNEEHKLYGITDDLINLLKSFTLETFRNFNLQDEQGAVDGPESTKDLSSWQEKHAVLVLSKVKELSQLRFRLCPRYLKERQFWRIYFTLVKNHVAKYELHAIRLEKLKQIAIENKKDPNTSAYEVEMLEARKPTYLEPATSLE